MRIAHWMLIAALCAVAITLGVSHIKETANTENKLSATMQWPEPSMTHKETMTTNNTEPEVKSVSQQSFERAKLGVALAESHNKDIGVHDDGKSYGRLGVTVSACAQLFKLHLISDDEYAAVMNQPSMLSDPVMNDRYGSMYLRYVCERGSVQGGPAVDYPALVGRYHGGSASRQKRYHERTVARLREYDKRQEKKDAAIIAAMNDGWHGGQCRCIWVPVTETDSQVAQ